MPTYEYACTACGHKLDAVQKFTDDPLTECPECGGTPRKVYGAVGIAFKGSGFYKTDSWASTAKTNGEAKKSPDSTPASTESKSEPSSTKADSASSSSDGASKAKDPKPASSTTS